MNQTATPRYVAALVLRDVLAGQSLAYCLEANVKHLPERERAWVQAAVFNACRFYPRCEFILTKLLSKPLKNKDHDVYALLIIGLVQILFMYVPTHAAVSETVAALSPLKKIWAKALVNATLRNFLRQRESLLSVLENSESAFYAHPEWMIQAWQQQYPEQWQKILTANNAHPPMSLRVNKQRYSREAYANLLKKAGITNQSIPYTTHGIMLKEPISVQSLPEFSQGAVSVQDGAAQLAAPLLALETGMRVLDACAAPGGKLMHMLEWSPEIECVAVDIDEQRLQRIQENLQRLRLRSNCVCADVAELAQWWDGKYFDRILLDAPCSATGVIRRHPDIKLLRKKTDIAGLATQQLKLLNTVWQTLRAGGQLLYCTCSIFREENAQILETFCQQHSDVRIESIDADWGMPCTIGRQILPGMHDMDGFYYARLVKLRN